jgi:type II secretory pathway predicted ATPase ExeA
MERNSSLPVEHWGFERWPFPSVPTVDQFYPTSESTEALARIEYLVESRRRLGALLGQSGVGKSLVLQVAARKLRRQRRAVASLSALAATPRELLWNLAAGMGAAPFGDNDVLQLWRRVTDRVAENSLQQMHTVLLVDDVGQAGHDVVMQLARLSRLESSSATRWTIVLAAEPSQAEDWHSTLRDLVDLRIDLGNWSADDTVGFVQTALVEAGCIEPVFDESALVRLHELAAGVPRQVSRLADFALLAAAAAGLRTIDADAVEAAADATTWPTPELDWSLK